MLALLMLKFTKSGRKSIKLDRQGNSLFLPMKIGNVILKFLVDTGASTMVIFSSSYSKISDNYHYTKSISIMIADGQEKICPVIDFTYCNGKTYNTEIAIMEDSGTKSYDGLVGMELLEKMKASIDIERNIMYIEDE